mgnify:CR=1 FL=1
MCGLQGRMKKKKHTERDERKEKKKKLKTRNLRELLRLELFGKVRGAHWTRFLALVDQDEDRKDGILLEISSNAHQSSLAQVVILGRNHEDGS